LIFVPAVEPFHLLGLSDLYHEVAHIILFREEKRLFNPFLGEVALYFQQQVKSSRQDGRPASHRETLHTVEQMWKSRWAIEFACDMVAAYLAGPAYGWANVRLCVNLSDDVYATDPDKNSHPADDSRNTSICLMLEKIGAKNDAEQVKHLWGQFVSLAGHSKPQDFEDYYPSGLLEKQCELLYEGCQSLMLMSYDLGRVQTNDLHIGTLLNEAWKLFNQDPDSFGPWELGQVATVKKELGV
jgi:hypothetical protein